MLNRRLSRAILATAAAALLIAPLAYADHADGGDGGNATVSSSTTTTASTPDGSNAPSSSTSTSGSATVTGSSTTQGGGASGTLGTASGSGSTDGESGDAREARWQAQFSQAFQGQSLSNVQASLDASQPAPASGGSGSAPSSTPTAQNVLQAAQTVLGQDPSNAQALQAAGVAEADLGDHKKALADLQTAVALNPNATNTSYNTLGTLLTGEGDHGIKLFADGKQVGFSTFGQAPVIEDGRTMVPVRAIMASLGATVSWDASTQTVTITQASTTVQLQVGSTTATVNGQTVTLDVPPGLMNGRTMLPIRFIAQMLGEQVQWYGSSQLIALTPPTTAPTGTSSTGTVTGTVYGTAG